MLELFLNAVVSGILLGGIGFGLLIAQDAGAPGAVTAQS